MAAMASGFIWCSVTDHGFTAYNRWFRTDRASGFNRDQDFIGIMPIHFDHVPAVGLEPFRRIVQEPVFDSSIDGNTIIVPKSN